MRRSITFRHAAACLALALSTHATLLRASGGDDFSENPFMPQFHVAAAELQAYAGGKLGIVMPSYWRVYQFLAYRALTGHPLAQGELAQLGVRGYSVGPAAGGYDYAYSEEKNGVGAWLAARASVRGAAAVKVGVDTDMGDYTMVVNCPADAFDRASKTLAQRIEQGGQQWAAVWLAAQDAVFANCSPQLPQMRGGGGAPVARPLTLPAAAPAKAPAWLLKDLAYQRAAAHFYAGRFDEARAGFTEIAADKASPWQPLGRYLAARALIRSAAAVPNAVLAPTDARVRERLTQARGEMTAIAPDYAPARRLISWIDVRLRPDERRRELSAALAVDVLGPASVQMLADYLVLMDKLEPSGLLAAADPMTAWIGAMQANAVEQVGRGDEAASAQRRLAALAGARAQWDKRHEAAWLVALLTNARKGDLKPAETKAAAAVKADSPAYVTLQYHLARLALADGRVKEADATVSALLDKPQPVSTRNRLLRLKMVSAAGADAALAAAARIPAEAGGEAAVAEGAKAAAAPQFDEDLRAHLEQHLPLALLVQLKPKLAASEQAATADLAWTRAVLLGQYAVADALTDEVARERATTRPLYARYKAAATPAAKREAALLILSNTPELTPHVNGAGADNAGAYWSCESRVSGDDGMDQAMPAFVTAAERAQVDKEATQLRALPKRSSYLIPLMIDWASRNKADPEAPKALHFLVASTRFECGAGAREAKPRNYSKEAFDFLHKQFPKSEWTAKTKYYY
jgi:hypothetical protein